MTNEIISAIIHDLNRLEETFPYDKIEILMTQPLMDKLVESCGGVTRTKNFDSCCGHRLKVIPGEDAEYFISVVHNRFWFAPDNLF